MHNHLLARCPTSERSIVYEDQHKREIPRHAHSSKNSPARHASDHHRWWPPSLRDAKTCTTQSSATDPDVLATLAPSAETTNR